MYGPGAKAPTEAMFITSGLARDHRGETAAGQLDQHLDVEANLGELAEIRLNVEVLVELTGRCLPAMVARKAGGDEHRLGGRLRAWPVHGDLRCDQGVRAELLGGDRKSVV